MKRHLYKFILLGLLIHAISPQNVPAQELHLATSLNRTQIYTGESVVLTVNISGASRPQAPDLSRIKNCAIRMLGSYESSSYTARRINGKIKRISHMGRTFTYEVKPTAIGSVVIGPVTVRDQGKLISDPGKTITVAGLDDQDWVRIAVEPSRETVLVDEPFDVTLTIELKRLPRPNQAIDPMLPSEPPKLTVPFLELVPIEGLDTMTDVTGLLQSNLVQQQNASGFAVNSYVLRADPMNLNRMFAMINGNQNDTARFRFKHDTVERDGQGYHRYRVLLRYRPKEQGSHTFGPVEFKGKIIRGANAQGGPVTQPIFAVGSAATVRVVPPPEEGMPATHIGAVGKDMEAEAFLDAMTCNVGDPLTLTLRISGDVNVANVRPLALAVQPALSRDFRVYEDNMKILTHRNGKDFVYTIRPIRAGTLELPAIKVSYYNTKDRAYRTRKTKPLPLRVHQSTMVDTNIIITATSRLDSDHLTDDMFLIAPITVATSGSSDMQMRFRPWHIALCCLGPLFFACLVAVQHIRDRRDIARNAQRRANAASAMDTQLQQLGVTPKDQRAAHRDIYSALRSFISERFSAQADSMTPQDAASLLSNNRISAKTSAMFIDVLDRSIGAAYSDIMPADADAQSLRETALTAVARIESELDDNNA